MSLLTKGIGIVKKLKHRYDAKIKENTKVYISPVRRIERIKTDKKLLAMTFDDGPSHMLPNPVGNHSEGLTLTLMNILDSFGAKGTFDVIGSTAGNYPDKPGKEGSASWGGVKYDHYPDINCDDQGGVAASHEIVERLIKGGHEITNHSYAHILFGKKLLVYGARAFWGDFKKVLEDLKRNHRELSEHHDYEMKLARPPHYVDKIQKGLSSYDAYAMMNYQYMAASFDGAGWLPLADYEQEVKAMHMPISKALAEDENYFCGQIIFQKDGFNMARRTPVADGLAVQLKLLYDAGYEVITVSELLKISPFADLGEGDEFFEESKKLDLSDFCVAFSDNTVRTKQMMTRGELCMTFFGKKRIAEKIENILNNKQNYCKDVDLYHPYGAAIKYALDNGFIEYVDSSEKVFEPDSIVKIEEVVKLIEQYTGRALNRNFMDADSTLNRGRIIEMIANAI